MQTITIPKPDDWHIHLRDSKALASTVPAVAEKFARALVMPNLLPPITTPDQALAYRQQILAACPENSDFNPLMALYLTATTTKDTVKAVADSPEILSFKLYPAGATTHSSAGITNLEKAYPIFAAMAEQQVPLCIHGEVTDPEVDIFDREKVFIDKALYPLMQTFPALPIVLEHITTKHAVDFIAQAPENIAATITAHHLWLNRNDMLVGGIKPHYYCLPILKTDTDRKALLAAATSGSKKYFLGSDSAPHPQSHKQSACGCAGIYTANATLEYYAEIFAQNQALDKLAGFASINGAEFYGLEINKKSITLIESNLQIAEQLPYLEEQIIPFLAGKILTWRAQP